METKIGKVVDSRRVAVYEQRGTLTTAVTATGEIVDATAPIPEMMQPGKWVQVTPIGGLWQVINAEV